MVDATSFSSPLPPQSTTVYHNCQTYNLQRLIVLTCRQLEGASKRGADVAVANLLCLLRILLQDLMEHLTPAQLQAFLSWPAPGAN